MAEGASAGVTPAKTPARDETITRKGFISWLTVAWLGFAAAVGGFVTTMARFMFPNVLFEPPSYFKAGFPADYQAGEVDERWKEKFQVWIVKTPEMIYALITVCTHLGCIPNWLAAQNKFKCPCHGSGYYRSGINFEGPRRARSSARRSRSRRTTARSSSTRRGSSFTRRASGPIRPPSSS